MASVSKKVFVSHSSKDKVLADRLVDLLTTGCAVNPNDILCTSLEGKGIPQGTSNFIEFLRGQIQKPDLVILLLGPNFFDSQFCLCELGAVWGLGLPNFPLVVPPVDRRNLKTTLAVTQCGDIGNVTDLDDLRDRVKATVGTDVPTSTWNVRRDTFLKGLNVVLKSLPIPTSVPVQKLQEQVAQYSAAISEIEVRDRVIATQKLRIADLDKLKDRAEGRAIAKKYSSADEHFELLRQTATQCLYALKSATRSALYWEFRSEQYYPNGDAEWNEVAEADTVEEVHIDKEDSSVTSRDDHPRIAKAQAALREIAAFLRDPGDPEFLPRLEEEHEFTASIRNKEFWAAFLVKV